MHSQKKNTMVDDVKSRDLTSGKISSSKADFTDASHWDDPNTYDPYSAQLDDSGLTLYHVTTKEAADKIAKEGFKGGMPNQFQGFESQVKGVYGWANKNRAIAEAQRMVSTATDPALEGIDNEIANELAIVKFKVPRKDFSRLRADEDSGAGSNDWIESLKGGSAALEGDLAPEHIQEIITHGDAGAITPMDQSSRMARAEQMGFDTKNPVYRGSTQDDFMKKSGRWGDATYFADSPSNAEKYAGDFGYGSSNEFLKGANVGKAYVRGKIFDPRDEKMVNQLFNSEKFKQLDKEFLAKNKVSLKEFINQHDFESMEMAAPAIKELGFDGYRALEPENYYSTAVFDQKNIRGANAKFDPNKKDSSDILAGVTPLLGGASVAAALSGLTKGNRK